MPEIFHIAHTLANRPQFPVVMATLVSVTGSSYRKEGARRLIPESGDAWGAISGGCLEADLDERARRLLGSSSDYDLVTYDTSDENDILWGTGAGCEGVVQILLEKITTCPPWVEEVIQAQSERRCVGLAVEYGATTARGTFWVEESFDQSPGTFFQVIPPPIQLVIFGAGDDAMPLCQLAHELGWEKKISDPRRNLLTSDRFPHAEALVHCPADSAVPKFTWDDWTAAVVMTHRYQFDRELLSVLLPMHIPFLGLLGPQARGARLIREIGFDPKQVDLHNPIGLDLGGDGATAIALSVVAEIQATFNRRSGRPLRDRNHPIHQDD